MSALLSIAKILSEIPSASDFSSGLCTLDHIGIAVCHGDLEAQVKLYCMMGFQVQHQEIIYGKDQVHEVLLSLTSDSNKIQLLEPLNESSPLHKRMQQNRGLGGLHHIAWRVEDIQQAFYFFQKQGFHIIDPEPRLASQGTTVFFIHPRSPKGNPLHVLFEIVEHPHLDMPISHHPQSL